MLFWPATVRSLVTSPSQPSGIATRLSPIFGSCCIRRQVEGERELFVGDLAANWVLVRLYEFVSNAHRLADQLILRPIDHENSLQSLL